jgi:Na+/H+ antiporter NhaD/arsenite permease-like protein
MIATLGRFAREQILVIGTAAVAAAFLISGRVTAAKAHSAIDYDLLLVLFALLVTVEILRESGYLDRAVAGTVQRFSHTRALTAGLILVSGALASLVTNDVALFVVIPITVIASRLSDFDIEDAVVLEIIAANLIGCLTPLGNPQNLFIHHNAGWSPARFVMTMLPFVAWCALGLFASVLFLGKSHRITIAAVELPPRKALAGIAGAVCFALVLLEIAHVLPHWVGAAVALAAGAIILRTRMKMIDLSIVPLFFFAFIVVEGLRTFDVTAMLRGSTYFVSIALSQIISNVPATILLSPFAAGDWRELLYGVNAGGCGTIIASLANLLGWRIYVKESNRDPRFFWRLTAINFAFLAWAGLGGWVLLLWWA